MTSRFSIEWKVLLLILLLLPACGEPEDPGRIFSSGVTANPGQILFDPCLENGQSCVRTLQAMQVEISAQWFKPDGTGDGPWRIEGGEIIDSYFKQGVTLSGKAEGTDNTGIIQL